MLRLLSTAVIAVATLLAARPASGTLPAVKADGKLTVIYAEADTPFLGVGPDGPRGFDYDVLQGFAARHGLRVELTTVRDAAELIPALLAGRAEVIGGAFTHTPERARQVLFTGEVTPQRHVVVSFDPAPAITSVERLRAVHVGTVAGTSWEAATRAAGVPPARLDATLPFETSAFLAAVAEKKPDAVVTGLFYALLLRRADPRVRLGLLLGEPGHHGYAVAPGQEELRDALEAYLDGVRDTAGWYRILIKHFGQEAPEIFRRARTE
jgi:membrane-bound lytic murein transglycosylase F